MMKKIIAFSIFAFLFLIFGCSDDNDNITESEPIEIPVDTIFVAHGSMTIQAAIDSAGSGDIILVGDGIYQGEGNRDIALGGKSVIIKSLNGPAAAIIDCQGDSTNPHQAFYITMQEHNAVIDGFTIRNGYAGNGGAIYLRSASPTIKNCVFYDNHAYTSGGAIRCKSSSPDITNCTFVENSSAMIGGAIFLLAGSSPYFENCIIAFSTAGEGIAVREITSVPTFACCNIYGNEGGDWIDDIADQAGINNNISVDPLLCDTAEDNYHLQAASPCAAGNNDCAELIGAFPVDCD